MIQNQKDRNIEKSVRIVFGILILISALIIAITSFNAVKSLFNFILDVIIFFSSIIILLIVIILPAFFITRSKPEGPPVKKSEEHLDTIAEPSSSAPVMESNNESAGNTESAESENGKDQDEEKVEKEAESNEK